MARPTGTPDDADDERDSVEGTVRSKSTRTPAKSSGTRQVRRLSTSPPTSRAPSQPDAVAPNGRWIVVVVYLVCAAALAVSIYTRFLA